MQEQAKQAVGEEAAKWVEAGMQVGLGTGTTAVYVIRALGKRCQEGLKIHALPSSNASRQLAHSLGIPLLDPEKVTYLDLTIDGADQITPELQMIKGGGGALLREKIVASMSAKMVAIVDETKWSPTLGPGKLPVEVIPFGSAATAKAIEKLGWRGTFRPHFVTDQGNWILDLDLPTPLQDPEALERALLAVPGVVETGLFLHFADVALVGHFNGAVERKIRAY